MKIGRKYTDSIIFWSPFTHQIISSNPSTRLVNYEILLKGKSNKDIQNIFKTLMYWFDDYSRTHISAVCVLFLKSIFYVDYMDYEVIIYNYIELNKLY